MAYFLWRLFSAQCPFVAELTGLLTSSETNQVTFDGRFKNLHNAMAFVADVSRVLGQYLNSCVVASMTAGLSDPGSHTLVSLAPLLLELSWGTYHGVDRLPPALITLLHQQETRRQYASRATPGDHETCLRREEAIQDNTHAAGGKGGGRNGGGGSGGGRGGGGGGGCGRDRPGAEGIVHNNPHHRPNLALLPGGNMRDVIRTFALQTLGGSTWCKRWHHGGRCF